MAALLRLPVELRLNIYSLAISSSPNIINVDEGATSTDPPRSLVARSLSQVDEQLSTDMMPLYWSSNIFEAYRLTGMGHYISTDRTFHRWLRAILKDSVRHLRYLRFKGTRPAIDEEMQSHETECIMIVDVDLKRQKTLIWNKNGEVCLCDHALVLQSEMEGMMKPFPTVDGQVRPSLQDLWNLFEYWFSYTPLRPSTRPITRRTWDEFERQTGALSGV